jgi:hypothetical protein
MMLIRCSAALLLTTLAAGAQTAKPPVWEMESSGTTAGLRGVHAVGGGVVWASGEHGTVLRTEDSGYMWQSCAMPPGAEKLDFRGIWAWDANTAVVMSSGPGDLSRLYKTTDGCSHWTLLFANPDKEGFWDAIAFSDRERGFLLGDPVGGSFAISWTADGGLRWHRMHAVGLSATADTAGAFAASNSSLLLEGPVMGEWSLPLFASGGSSGATVYSGSLSGCTMELARKQPEDCLKNWDFERDPVPIGTRTASSGIFSIASRPSVGGSARNEIAVGGDYTHPDLSAGVAAYFASAGPWTAASTPPGGYRSAVAWDADDKIWITVGPNGSDYSADDGKTWQSLEHAASSKPGEWNALSLPWAVGPNGRIAKLNSDALPRRATAATPKSSK